MTDHERQLREIVRRLRANEISENYAYSRIVAITATEPGAADPRDRLHAHQRRRFADAERAAADAIISGPLQERLKGPSEIEALRVGQAVLAQQSIDLANAPLEDMVWVFGCTALDAIWGPIGEDASAELREFHKSWAARYQPPPAENSASSPSDEGASASAPATDEPLQFLSHKEGEGNV